MTIQIKQHRNGHVFVIAKKMTATLFSLRAAIKGILKLTCILSITTNQYPLLEQKPPFQFLSLEPSFGHASKKQANRIADKYCSFNQFAVVLDFQSDLQLPLLGLKKSML